MKSTELKKLIQKEAQGTFFSVTTKKRTTGTIRVYNCRLGVHKGVTGEGMPFNPDDKNLIVVWDRKVKGYRMVNVDGIQELKVRGKYLIKDCKFIFK